MLDVEKFLVALRSNKDLDGKLKPIYLADTVQEEIKIIQAAVESSRRDATAKDADKAYELLRRAETEMRYAGWNLLMTDNYARKDIYDDIKEFLK